MQKTKQKKKFLVKDFSIFSYVFKHVNIYILINISLFKQLLQEVKSFQLGFNSLLWNKLLFFLYMYTL